MKRFFIQILAMALVLGMVVSCSPVSPVVTLPQGETEPSAVESSPLGNIPAASLAADLQGGEVITDPDLPPVSSVAPMSCVPKASQPAVPQISYNPHAGESGGDGVGGEENFYNTTFVMEFRALPGVITDLVGDPAWDWVEKQGREVNLYTFIHAFGLSREEVEKASCIEINGKVEHVLSEKLVEELFTLSQEEIYRLYALPSSVVVGRNAYAAEYFVSHSVEEIQKAGITSQKLGEKYALLAEACNTYEQAATLTKRLKELQKAEQEKGETFAPIGVDRMIEENPLGAAIWLGESSFKEWEKEGVGISLVDEHFVNMVYAGKDRRQIAAFVAGVKKIKEDAGIGGKLSSREEPLFAEYPEITLAAIKSRPDLLLEYQIPLAELEVYLYDILADMGDFKYVGTFMYYLQQLEQAQLSA